MHKYIFYFYFVMLLALPPATTAQENIPRDVSPNEMVTLDRDLPMKTALNILSQYSLRHEGKIIIDPSGQSGPINVMVDNMYWKRALEYILRSNLKRYVEQEKYYEVVPLQESEAKGEAAERITSRTREIEINALFFEADYATVVEAGIDWSVINNGKVAVSSTFSPTDLSERFEAEVSDTYRQWDIFALLRTFESLNKGEVIANPTIKVMEGEEGKIKVGENFFLTTRDFAGNTRFQEYESGVILTVTPQVMGHNDSTFVHLDIKAERSSVIPDPEAVTKAITESITQVLLLNGEETVIAGLFTNETTTSRTGIPILKDLPPWFFGLRYLFGYESKSFTKKELIIILQAVVLPTIEERMTSRLQKRNYIQQKRLEFKRRLRQLKTSNGTNGYYRRR